MLHPDDTNIYLVWLAMVELDIDDEPTSPNYKKILIQYWGPCARKKGLTDAQAYADCWKRYWQISVPKQQVWENLMKLFGLRSLACEDEANIDGSFNEE